MPETKFNYEANELRKAERGTEFRVKVRSDAGETRWLTLRPETFERIKAALVEQGDSE